MKKVVFILVAFLVIAPAVYSDYSDAVVWDTEWSLSMKYSMAIALHQGFGSSFKIMIASGLSKVFPDTPESLIALDKYASYTPSAENKEILDAFFMYIIEYIDGYFTLYEEPTLGEAFQKAILAWDNSGKYVAGYGD